MDDPNPQPIPASDATNPFTGVPIEINVCVGKARPLIRELVMLGENALLPLDSNVDDPVDLYVGDRLIARGLLEEKEGDHPGQLAVRLTEIIDLQGPS
ncbi:FliM/FliN family flagellar motor switch protein [Sulfitobacter mediterraneus]|uniref:FliM/FliN family flagellar motor switch protein n=1 Tax=Sulfitobacter mediterraneus TaxID=83219 RepID=UPI00193389D1|nr:FliM/FliN family flagellar motor C-terminal domain-containing protein [Sulfitobacter mediterraneus]MBM1308793.1 FliM/FliN family flagellar motor switch protein [Sulfitobacter mediterraneus]MBM1312678.1 FliM/FliN family flagellar motor switch protein [Sulfitobacter mediterraneus]MBM1321060.1 FliM/FliN family flagellar motor switch protein [Sulfitobacter mediterraneus]MBM1324947.1 FliM/FliN family flagellar motor switch protein [Sulfitobacter mediterraneus]MBM1396294.1 FliM/FliN family flagel